jgi:hypothetical protein
MKDSGRTPSHFQKKHPSSSQHKGQSQKSKILRKTVPLKCTLNSRLHVTVVTVTKTMLDGFNTYKEQVPEKLNM